MTNEEWKSVSYEVHDGVTEFYYSHKQRKIKTVYPDGSFVIIDIDENIDNLIGWLFYEKEDAEKTVEEFRKIINESKEVNRYNVYKRELEWLIASNKRTAEMAEAQIAKLNFIDRLFVKDIINKDKGLSVKDGNLVFWAIKKHYQALEPEGKLEVNFAGINKMTTHFINIIVGQVYMLDRPEEVLSRVEFLNFNPQKYESIFQDVFDNAMAEKTNKGSR